MSTRTYLIADTHWGHKGVCQFTHGDTGVKIRPWDDPDVMNEEMSQLWNETVRPTDKVYVLGDWAINRRFASYGTHLHGDKVLIMGNHDIFKKSDYGDVFRDFRAYHVMKGVILSHIPVHPSQLRRFSLNICGHLHTNTVRLPNDEVDPQYICVSAEQIGFKPILLDEVFERARQQGAIINTDKDGNR